MAKRGLSKEEQRLWQLYTKDIRPIDLTFEIPTPHSSEKAYDIRVPPKSEFKRPVRDTLSNHGSLKNNDANWSKKLKQGRAKIDGKIDLHGMTCVQAHEKLHRFLERAQQSGKRVVLVVTGKGGPKTHYDNYRFSDFEDNRGVLRREVPMWLSGGAMRHLIVSFQEARAKDGGAGALYVVLKRIS